MVFYFTSTVVEPSAFIYVGKDKFESMPLELVNIGNKLSNNGLRRGSHQIWIGQ